MRGAPDSTRMRVIPVDNAKYIAKKGDTERNTDTYLYRKRDEIDTSQHIPTMAVRYRIGSTDSSRLECPVKICLKTSARYFRLAHIAKIARPRYAPQRLLAVVRETGESPNPNDGSGDPLHLTKQVKEPTGER